MPVPDDFDAFWNEQKAKLAGVPMNPRLTPVTANSSKKMECFDVQLDCAGGAPVSGYYAKPAIAKPKSLPIILLLHGAGVTSSSLPSAVAWSTRGFLAMDINAHGIPNGKPAQFYKDLEEGTLKDYRQAGRESRETCYFLGMFLRVDSRHRLSHRAAGMGRQDGRCLWQQPGWFPVLRGGRTG